MSASVEVEEEVEPRAFRLGWPEEAKQEKRPEVHIFEAGKPRPGPEAAPGVDTSLSPETMVERTRGARQVTRRRGRGV